LWTLKPECRHRSSFLTSGSLIRRSRPTFLGISGPRCDPLHQYPLDQHEDADTREGREYAADHDAETVDLV
jgi:hypothetical protein